MNKQRKARRRRNQERRQARPKPGVLGPQRTVEVNKGSCRGEEAQEPSDNGLKLSGQEGPNSQRHRLCDHEWVVFSTALGETCLMLQCIECRAMGSVDDPSQKEWNEAFFAPNCPYRWQDVARVRIRFQTGPRFVMRREPGKPCGCPRECKTPGDYDRVPGEITTRRRPLTVEERGELEDLAGFVGGSDICSHSFPLFLRSYEQTTGDEHSAAVHEIVGRIERINDKGLHFGPTVVAQTLRDYADSELAQSTSK
jgi:hypothetical protein